MEELLDQWRLEEAGKLLSPLLEARRPNPAAPALAARLAFLEGRYGEAQKRIERALSLKPADERWLALRLLVQQTRAAAGPLKRYESEHFALYLDEPRDGILAPYALEALEAAQRAMAKLLGFRPRERVRVEVFPDATAFNRASTLSLRDIEVTGAVGVAKFHKVMVLSPRSLILGYRWLDTLSHEYIHFVLTKMSHNRAPIWFHEGLAKFAEAHWKGTGLPYLNPAAEALLARATREGGFVGFRRMEPSLIYLDSAAEVHQAYAEAATALEFILERGGTPTLRRIIQHMARGKERGAEEALRSVLGLSFEQFEKGWRAFLARKGLSERKGVRVRQLRVRRGGPVGEKAWELKAIQSEVARRRAALGDRLRARGRLRAAAIEYRRALREDPHSAVILNKLGVSLLSLRRSREALEHLRRAKALDPDYVTTYVHLGYAHARAGDLRGARAAWEEAIELNPFDPRAHLELARVYRQLGEEVRSRREARIGRRLLRQN
ncbi:MAG: tetratricopeptide repeat protein [Nitrospinota bacterium]